MSNSAIYTALTEIFRDVFRRDDMQLTPALSAKDVQGWDRFKQIEIILATEARFGIRLQTREIDALSCVGDLAGVIAGHAAVSKQDADALRFGQHGLRAEPLDPVSHVVVSGLHARAGNPVAAETAERAAMDLAPENAELKHQCAMTLSRENRFDASLQAALQAVALAPDSWVYLDALGQIAMQAGDIDTAKSAFLAAAALAPQEPAFMRAVAHCFGVQRQFDEATRYMRQAVDLRPEIAENNAILAHYLASSNQIGEASAFLRRAVALAPEIVQYQQDLAHNMTQQEQSRVIEHIPVFDEDGSHKALVGKDDWLFLDNDANQTMSQYRGVLLFSDEQIRAWNEEVLWRRDFFSRHNIRHVLLIAPNKESVYDQFLPKKVYAGSLKPVDQFLNMAREILPTCYPLDALRDQRDVLAVFDRVDTHWTVLGALAACMVLNDVHEAAYGKKLANFGTDNHPVMTFWSTGDLGEKFIPQRTAERVALDPGKPRTILVADNEVNNHGNIQVYNNELGNGEKCLIFGDSFGINLVQILKEYFTTTIFCHSSLIDAGMVEAQMPDIVISEHVERFLIVPPGTSEGFDINDVISAKRSRDPAR